MPDLFAAPNKKQFHVLLIEILENVFENCVNKILLQHKELQYRDNEFIFDTG